jgi:hypothetical protein
VILIVAFELVDPRHNQLAVVNKIRNYGDWARVTDTTYLVNTTHSPQQVRNWIATALVEGDTIYVSRLGRTSAWLGFPEILSNWIRERQ